MFWFKINNEKTEALALGNSRSLWVKRNVMISEVEKGGLNMLDIDSMVRIRRVMCVKNIWKTIKVRVESFFK